MSFIVQPKFTSEEADAIIGQLNGRLKELKELQVEAGKEGKTARVVELEDFIKTVSSGRDKLMEEYYKSRP